MDKDQIKQNEAFLAREWARGNAVWRQIEDGRICVRPKDILAVVNERDSYRKALEEIASHESGVNAERAIAALAMPTT